jgi:hypothetical protein
MDLLSRIASWPGENEATISAVVGITVLAGAYGVVSRARFAEIEKKPTDRLDAHESVLNS